MNEENKLDTLVCQPHYLLAACAANLLRIWLTPAGSRTTLVPSHFALFVNSAHSSLISTFCV
jgi:hypothetical protein